MLARRKCTKLRSQGKRPRPQFGGVQFDLARASIGYDLKQHKLALPCKSFQPTREIEKPVVPLLMSICERPTSKLPLCQPPRTCLIDDDFSSKCDTAPSHYSTFTSGHCL